MATSATCDFSLLADADVISLIRDAVSKRHPFSLIRIGDGEAVVLGMDEDLTLQDLAYLHGHWGAEGVTLSAVAQVRHDLYEAIHGADVVGIRDDIIGVDAPEDLLQLRGAETLEVVRSTFGIRPDEKQNLSAIGARRIALLHRVLGKVDWSDQQRLCSAWIHWELLASGALTDLLGEMSEVGLVTAKPELARLVEANFDVRTKTVLVPDKQVDVPDSGAHVPRRYQTISEDLDFPEGSVVLVGAGIPGKVYCNWLKARGCVAIDIGAVFDAWIGKASRPRVLESRFGVRAGGEVPDELRLQPRSTASGRIPQPRWKPTAMVR